MNEITIDEKKISSPKSEQNFPSPSGGGRVGVARGKNSGHGKPHLNPPLEGEEIRKTDQHIKHYTRETVRRSRKLRSNPTEAEKALWNHLRKGGLEGYKFRRQFFIGKYIVDFVCVECRLVVEADGGQHCDNSHDKRRDAYITQQGYNILRFWNNEITENMEGVMEIIRASLFVPTPPQPSPKRGGSNFSSPYGESNNFSSPYGGGRVGVATDKENAS